MSYKSLPRPQAPWEYASADFWKLQEQGAEEGEPESVGHLMISRGRDGLGREVGCLIEDNFVLGLRLSICKMGDGPSGPDGPSLFYCLGAAAFILSTHTSFPTQGSRPQAHHQPQCIQVCPEGWWL